MDRTSSLDATVCVDPEKDIKEKIIVPVVSPPVKVEDGDTIKLSEVVSKSEENDHSEGSKCLVNSKTTTAATGSCDTAKENTESTCSDNSNKEAICYDEIMSGGGISYKPSNESLAAVGATEELLTVADIGAAAEKERDINDNNLSDKTFVSATIDCVPSQVDGVAAGITDQQSSSTGVLHEKPTSEVTDSTIGEGKCESELLLDVLPSSVITCADNIESSPSVCTSEGVVYSAIPEHGNYCETNVKTNVVVQEVNHGTSTPSKCDIVQGESKVEASQDRTKTEVSHTTGDIDNDLNKGKCSAHDSKTLLEDHGVVTSDTSNSIELSGRLKSTMEIVEKDSNRELSKLASATDSVSSKSETIDKTEIELSSLHEIASGSFDTDEKKEKAFKKPEEDLQSKDNPSIEGSSLQKSFDTAGNSIPPVTHAPLSAESYSRSESSAMHQQHQSSNSNSKPSAPLQRPKLLANLKPKNPRAEDDEADEDSYLASKPDTSPIESVIGGTEIKENTVISDRLPLRSSVVQFSSNSTMAGYSNVITGSLSSKQTNDDPVRAQEIKGPSSNTPYINKRSSLYVNSPDFSKKSQLLAPIETSLPSSSLSNDFVALQKDYPQNPNFDEPTRPMRSDQELRRRPPVVMMQPSGGDQRIIDASNCNNLSTPKMKTLDFSKLGSSSSGMQISEAHSETSQPQLTPHFTKSHTVHPFDFHEIRKKYNYISDLQLKPPSEPMPATGPSLARSATRDGYDHIPSNVGPPVSYPNLYVNTPEFTTQKFSIYQRTNQQHLQSSPPIEQRTDFVSPHHVSRHPPTAIHRASVYEERAQQKIGTNRGPEAQSSTFATSSTSNTMQLPRLQQSSSRSPSVNLEQGKNGSGYPLNNTKVQESYPFNNDIRPGYSGTVSHNDSHMHQAFSNNRSVLYGECSSNSNYQSSVIKCLARDEHPPGHPTLHAYSNDPTGITPSEHQPASGTSLKQQKTDMLSTELKRMHSPNQATSGNFMQAPHNSHMVALPQRHSPHLSSWIGGGQTSRSGTSGYIGQSLHPKTSQSPTHSKVVAGATVKSGSPYYQVPLTHSFPMDQRPNVLPSTEQKGIVSEKYVSTGELSRSLQGMLPSQPLVKHGSTNRYMNQYGQESQSHVQIKQEPKAGEYLRNSEQGPSPYLQGHAGVKRSVQAPVVQLPLSNYPMFQPSALTDIPPNPAEAKSSSRLAPLGIGGTVASRNADRPTRQIRQAATIATSTLHVPTIDPRIKRESPLDLSVKTVKTKADSTGGFYEAGYALSTTSSHVKPTNSLKVNYVPNFGQHQRSKGISVAGYNRQNVPPLAISHPPHVVTAINQSVVTMDYGPTDSQLMRNYPEPSRPGPSTQLIVSEREPIRKPFPEYTSIKQYPSNVPSELYNPGKSYSNSSSQRQQAYSISGPGLHYSPGYVDPHQHYRGVSPSSSQPFPPRAQKPQQTMFVSAGDQVIAGERKRHADFAHLSAGQQPVPKTIKTNETNNQRLAVPTEHYTNMYAKKGTPLQQHYGLEDTGKNDNKYIQPLPQCNNLYQYPEYKKELPLANIEGSHKYVTEQLDATADQKHLHQMHRPQNDLRPTHAPTADPSFNVSTSATNRIPVDANMCYSPAPGTVHPDNQQHRPSQAAFTNTQAYCRSLNMQSTIQTQPSSLPSTHPNAPHYQNSMPFDNQHPRHQISINSPAYPLRTMYQQFNNNQPGLPLPIKGTGADRNVISKLKNAIEEKQNQRLNQQKSSAEAQLEDNKADIASILAARIRTKGELKGYTGPPKQDVVELNLNSTSASINVNPKERFDPPPDMEGVSSLDLMDWGSTCNDFVEQLQTGKKKLKRRRVHKPIDLKVETNVVQILREAHGNQLPLESLVPREAIVQATSLRRVSSDGSSDEDKPLMLIRQLSLEKARLTESDAKSRSSSMVMSSVKSVGSGTMKGIKEKRLLQEKRYAARIANASSSENDEDVKKPPKPVRRKRNMPKQAIDVKDRKTPGDESTSKNKTKAESTVDPGLKTINKRASSSDSDTPVLKRIGNMADPLAKTAETEQNKTLIRCQKSDRGKPSNRSSDSSDSEVLSKKPRNESAAKLSEAEIRSECLRESLTPTRTSKMRRLLAPDVGTSKGKIIAKLKAKPEEHMTRLKKKQKLAEEKANSLVLRNDKVVQNQSVAKARNKPGPKSKILEPDEKKAKRAQKPSNPEDVENNLSSNEEEGGADTSSSDSRTVVNCRLRPRKAKSNDPADCSAVRGSGVEKKGTDLSIPIKGLATSYIGKRDNCVTQSATMAKRGSVKRSNPENKDPVSQDADESVDALPPNADEKVRVSKKGRNNNWDPQKYGPGWEDQLYEFKRSLKVPASLITIESPKWHRVSTSLPDLEPRSNSDEEETNAEKRCTSGLIDNALANIKPSSTLSSIIDLVHQRVIRPFKRLTHLGSGPDIAHDKKKTPTVGDNKSMDLLLPTPVLVKSVRYKGTENQDVEHVEEVMVKNVFPRERTKKSRTRREYNVEKNNEIIREIFGGEDRPASAPPGCVPAAWAQKTLATLKKVNEYEAIVINKITYEQKFEEYLGLYCTAEENNAVSNQSLQMAMSIDEAIKESVMIFQRPIVQGEDPEHGGLVKRKIGRRGYTRRKGSSGFDYIRKKKRPIPVNLNGAGTIVPCELMEGRRRNQITFLKDRNEQDISKEIKGWVLNKGVGESVLHKATRMNLLDVVAYCLIRLEMAPDQKDNAGYTPLHEASSRGHLDIARLLLQHGANPSETSPSGIRPLHDAVEDGDTEIVRLLLAYGADPKLATYAGQTPLDLAADDEEMEEFLKDHLRDLQSGGVDKKPWRFEGAWKRHVDPESGFNVLDGAPVVNHTEQNHLHRSRRKSRRRGSGDEFVKVAPNTRKSSSLNMTVKKLSHELNGSGVDFLDGADNCNSWPKEQVSLDAGESSLASFEADTEQFGANTNSDEGEMFEFEECDSVLPPVYFLRDEGTEKWCMLTDLQNLLKFKSKETLLKQICPPNVKKEELVREYKMNEFLQKATCLQLLCSGEKLNIRASKVSLIKYTDSVKNLLGVRTVVMQL